LARAAAGTIGERAAVVLWAELERLRAQLEREIAQRTAERDAARAEAARMVQRAESAEELLSLMGNGGGS
jgi:C4-dicarboxylate-specific signal transduction histidine kinase